jgi:hypothetical protein
MCFRPPLAPWPPPVGPIRWAVPAQNMTVSAQPGSNLAGGGVPRLLAFPLFQRSTQPLETPYVLPCGLPQEIGRPS